MWEDIYDQSIEPSAENIKEYINNKLYEELCLFLEENYKIIPKFEYSKCSMQKGWNVKFKKGGKSLCTIYPMEGYFIALVVIGAKEQVEAEEIIPTCTKYIQNLFSNTPFSCGGRWLMVEVKEEAILKDVFRLIQIRIKPKKKA